MSSFDEKLEALDVPHRFVEREILAEFRRDSISSRFKKIPNSFFLHKRERLESGESLFLPQAISDKKDYELNYNSLNNYDTIDKRRLSINNQSEYSLAHLECLESKNTNKVGHVEDESVIDQQLIIEKCNPTKVSSLNTDVGVSEKDDPPKEESKFIIKVKKTDQKLEISHKVSFDNDFDENIEDIEECPIDDMGMDKMNNLIFGDEPSRLIAKTTKVIQYWNKSSLLIPNVFRHLKDFEDDKDNLLEFQDYSRKELLVQSNGTKFKPSKERGLKKTKRILILIL